MKLIEAQNDYRTLYNRFNKRGKRLVVYQSWFGPTLGWAVGETSNYSPEMLEMGYEDCFHSKTWTSTREQAEASAQANKSYTADNAHLNFRVQGVTAPPDSENVNDEDGEPDEDINDDYAAAAEAQRESWGDQWLE